jgi:hypothetical protein
MPALTLTGFDAETYEEIVEDIDADLHADIDPNLDLGGTTPIGQTISAFSDRLAAAWEAIDIAYSAIDPRQAEGFLLDNVGVLRGVLRNDATFGEVELELDIDNGVNLPAGVIVSVAGEDGNQWELIEAFTAPGPGQHYLMFRAKVEGVYNALPGTITNIVTPVSGWNSATNLLAATPGRAVETDAQYRVRQETALAASGSGTYDAIRTAVIAVPGVIEALVYQNDADYPQVFDGVSLPPHSFIVIVYDGPSPAADDDEIAQAIWDNKPAGILSFGSGGSGTAVDSGGTSRTVAFARAGGTNILIGLTIVTDPARFPSVGGELAVKQRIVDYMTSILGLGDDVIALQVQACILETSGGVSGVTNVTAYTQNVTTIAATEIALFNVANIGVTVT